MAVRTGTYTPTLSVTSEKIALDIAKIKKYFFGSKTTQPLFIESNDSILRIPYKSFQYNRQFFYVVVINAKSGVEQVGYVSRILLMSRLSKGISYIERSDTTCRYRNFAKMKRFKHCYYYPHGPRILCSTPQAVWCFPIQSFWCLSLLLICVHQEMFFVHRADWPFHRTLSFIRSSSNNNNNNIKMNCSCERSRRQSSLISND
jgi:hypothetical protein